MSYALPYPDEASTAVEGGDAPRGPVAAPLGFVDPAPTAHTPQVPGATRVGAYASVPPPPGFAPASPERTELRNSVDLNAADRAALNLQHIQIALAPSTDALGSGGGGEGAGGGGGGADSGGAPGCVDEASRAPAGAEHARAPSPTAGASRARVRLRTAIMSAASMDPYLRARQRRADHWRPLRLRFDQPRYHGLPRAGKADGGGVATSPPRHQPGSARSLANLFAHAQPVGCAGPGSASPSLSTSGPPHLLRGRSSGFDRADVRLLRNHDANVQIPDQIGLWLTDRDNYAPNAQLASHRPQRILYTARVSLRFKDHIVAQSPCAYALACPFPVMIFQYAYDLWRVYTCAGCPAGVSSWDQPILWHSKGYDLRAYFHVYNNRVEVNYPTVRCPWGVLGCGSWNADDVRVHYFDRGSFGFRRVPCATQWHCCWVWEPFGEVVGRQRCPCNGPLVDARGTVRCGQCWCDHWLCSTCCCHYHYPGLVDAEETSTACDVALQAYFDGVDLTQAEFDERLDRALAFRYHRKRRGARGVALGTAASSKQYDLDSHAYSRTMTLVAVSIGAVTIAIQIFVVIAFALYVQYRSHRQWYIDYAHTLSRPEHYEQLVQNGTRAVENIVRGGGGE